LGQLFGGLGWVWVDEMDSRTTLLQHVTALCTCWKRGQLNCVRSL